MATSLRGCIVVINFPFSDLSGSKKRPALVIADWYGRDIILVQVTSVTNRDALAVELNDADFVNGSLLKPSYIRPNKIFTADRSIVRLIGKITDSKFNEVLGRVQSFLE